MVMAKGVEDTAFFRYTRLGTLTEVGADPTEFAVAPEEFHHRMARRQAELPLSMTTLSTHDTKRSEDTRARISVLAELAPEWQAALAPAAGAGAAARRAARQPAVAGHRRRLARGPRPAAVLRAEGRPGGRQLDRLAGPGRGLRSRSWPPPSTPPSTTRRSRRNWSPSWPCWRRTGPSTRWAPSWCS